MPPRVKPSTSRTRAGSSASRSLVWAAAHGSPTRHNLLIIGPTGIGKSFLASAFVERACRQGFSARYVRMPTLAARGRGRARRWLLHALADPVPNSTSWPSTTGYSRRCGTRSGATWSRSSKIARSARRRSSPVNSRSRLASGHGDPNQADAIVTGSCTTPTGSS